MNILLRIVNMALMLATVISGFFLNGVDFAPRVIISAVLIAYFCVYNVLAGVRKCPTLRLRILDGGAELILTFLVTTTLSLLPAGVSLYRLISSDEPHIVGFIVAVLTLVVGEAILFWNGIIRIYATSVQLGLRYRVLGIVLGWIPIANIVMLLIIYVKVHSECSAEIAKARLNEERANLRICATKYPILLVHGVFFRDSKTLNYWGRVPSELIKNGAELYYGEQQSALSVEDSAKELAARIEKIVEETGCGKLNIIAHSKGGLDSRYAISVLGCDKYVASLTTINTPHHGCLFAEYLLGKAPEKLVHTVEKTYNTAFRRLGDPNPDFLAAVKNLTSSFCESFNENVPDMDGVMYQSVGSKAINAGSGRFPLNISYPVVKKYDGDNDGLVALQSAEWGEKFTPIYPKGSRGITHADMIDLNREDIKGFDVREFYVQLAADLKNRGF